MSILDTRPEPSEFADYYLDYVRRVPDTGPTRALADQPDELVRLAGELGPAKSAYRYAEGKWTASQLVGHLMDTEWIFTTRAVRFARGDTTELPAVDQNVLAAGSPEDRDLERLAQDYRSLRAASLAMFTGLDDVSLMRRGTASGFEFSVRAFAWIIAGHARHHLDVLGERYR